MYAYEINRNELVQSIIFISAHVAFGKYIRTFFIVRYICTGT